MEVLQPQIGKSHITRPYSISSSPKEALKGRYMITVRKNDDGFASKYIHETWKTGTEVTASMPLGSFTYTSLRDAGTVIAVAVRSLYQVKYIYPKALTDAVWQMNVSVTFIHVRPSRAVI